MKRAISILVIFAILFTTVPIYNDLGLVYAYDNPTVNKSTTRVVEQNNVFFENKGQHGKEVDYYIDIYGGSVFYTKKGEINYILPVSEDSNEFWSFTETIIGGNANIQGEKDTQAKFNILLGDVKEKNIKGFTELSFGNLYKNIEIADIANNGSIERIYTVKPGGDVDEIQIQVDGVNELLINQNNELEWLVDNGMITLSAPYAYQVINGEEFSIDVKFSVNDNIYGFELGDYNRDYDLIIDPKVICSSFGDAGNVIGKDIHTDSEGNIIITGYTKSADYTTTTGAYDIDFSGRQEIFLSKFNSDFSTLISSTFLGGTDSTYSDEAYRIDIDKNDDIYIIGYTASPDFPFEGTPYDSTYTDNTCFIAKFNSDLQMIATTFIDDADINDLVIEPDGSILVTGNARIGFDEMTQGAYQTSMSYDSVHVTRYNSSLSNLLTSTVIDGHYSESGKAIKLSRNGDILLAGTVWSSDFPTTSNAYDTINDGSWDLFASVLSNDMSTLKASTFLGTSEIETEIDIDEDSYGNIFVLLEARTGFETNVESYQATFGGDVDAYIAKFSRDLSTLKQATYFGGSGYEKKLKLDINESNDVVISGATYSSNLPMVNAYDSYFEREEGFIAKFDNNLSELDYSTYLGALRNDHINGLYVDEMNTIYTVGYSDIPWLPYTDGVYSTASHLYGGFVLIIDESKTGLSSENIVKEKAAVEFIGYGAYETTKHLLSVKGALGISASIKYNSIIGGSYILGEKWQLNYDIKSVDITDNAVEILNNDGTKLQFFKTDNSYIPARDNYFYYSLEETSTDTFELSANEYEKLVISQNKVTSLNLKTGESISYVYNQDNLLSKVVDDRSNRYLEFGYNNGKLTSVMDNEGRTVNLSYNTNNMLESITDAEGTTTTFTYDTTFENLLISETDSNLTENQVLYFNGYDTDGRLVSVDDNNALNQVVTYEYDEDSLYNHIIVTRTDELGKTTEMVYDHNYNLVLMYDALDKVVSYNEFDKSRVVKSVDALNNETLYSYNSDGDVTNITLPNGEIISYDYYDGTRNLKSRSNTFNMTEYFYNNSNQITKVIETINGSETAITEYFYTLDGDLDYMVSPEGYVVDYLVDINGQLERIDYEDNNGNISKYEIYTYDAVGRTVSVTDSLNHSYTVEYYDNDLIKQVVNPLLEIMDYDYTVTGQVKSINNFSNKTVSYEYDSNMNIKKIYDSIIETPIDKYVEYFYDGKNRLTSVKDGEGYISTYEYYDNDLIQKEINPEGTYLRYTYYDDGMLNEVFTQDPDGIEKKIRSYSYDTLGNILTLTDAENNIQTYGYDSISRLTSYKDGNYHESQYTYDQLNRLVTSTDALNYVNEETFDKEGRTEYVQDQNDSKLDTNEYLHNNEYDAFGRLNQANYSGIRRLSLSYYSNSDLMETMTNGRNNVTTYYYDDLNRVSKVVDDIDIREYTYDTSNNRYVVTTKELGSEIIISTIEYTYDDHGNIVSFKDENNNVIAYSYDSNDNLLTMTYPGNKIVTYTYNDASKMESVTDWNNNTTTYAYNTDGTLQSTSKPNGTVETYTYYKNGWLKSKVDKDSQNNIISTYTYTYDAAGNITDEDGNGDNLTNIYSDRDELLTQENHDDSQVLMHQYDYVYDVTGNLITVTNNLSTLAMTYDDGNILSTYDGQSVTVDNDGNMTYGPLNGSMTDYVYNSRNELTSISSGLFSMTYDSEGRRVSKTENSNTTNYVVNPLAGYNQVLMEETNGQTTYYIYGLGLISEETNSVQTYYHFDKRGSTIALTDANEVITDTYEYGPYGEIINHTGSDDTNFLFNGRYGVISDTDSLLFMMTRYYSTDTRRFTSQDVIFGSISDSLSINQFIFTMNNPINFFDPWGRDRWFIDDGIDGITITSDLDKMPLGALATDWYLYLEHEDWEQDDLAPVNMATDLTLKEMSRAIATKSAYDLKNGVYKQIWKNAAIFYASLAVIGYNSFKGAVQLSNNKVEHVLKNHTAGRMQNTVDAMMEKGLAENAENLVNSKGFFNTSWSEQTVIDATNQAYNQAIKNGVPSSGNFDFTTSVFGENVTLNFQDGIFKSAWGDFKLNLLDFGY